LTDDTASETASRTDGVAGLAGVVCELFDAMPVPMAALGGPQHRILAANAALRSLLREDVVGKTCREAFPELIGQHVYELFDRVYTTGKPEVAEEWLLQIERGHGLATETYADFICVPWHRPDGAVAGLLIAGTDMTAQVRQRLDALDRAAESDRRYRAARDVVADLQEALLPRTLPLLPQARLAARYLVAEHEQAAGGDWFDAILLGDRNVALVVGDVVGHGVAASVAMGQLRAVLGDRLAANPDLPGALAEIDAFAARTPGLRAATLAVAVLDPADGTLCYATCGHPPPLLVGPDGSTRFLPTTGSGPLGTGSPPVLVSAELEPGALLLLYSDGLIERPGRPADQSMAELARVAADAALGAGLAAGGPAAAAERVCEQTVGQLARTGYADDVTALAAQRLAAPVPPARLVLPATLAALTTARRSMTRWLREIGASAEDAVALQLAVAEVLVNAVEHAYPPGQPGLIEIDAALRHGGYVECRIADHGAWRVPAGPESGRGHGLSLVEHLIDDVLIGHPPQAASERKGARGTVVTLRHSFRRPAILAAAGSGQEAAYPDEEAFRVDAGIADSEALVVVRGPVDVFTAEEFTRELLTASGGGTTPLTVDLTGVTRLASAGVSALFQVREQLRAQQQGLQLIAAPGSSVAFVLDLVRLPYRTGTPGL
jgi:serine phosphatase RsbU (regulator of sigma subunit)/anti-sigma regulatory factor (Ser/Thr protein kinase)/anti-anti-sigma regulatory factor